MIPKSDFQKDDYIIVNFVLSIAKMLLLPLNVMNCVDAYSTRKAWNALQYIQAWKLEKFTLSTFIEGQMFTSIVCYTLSFGTHIQNTLFSPNFMFSSENQLLP